MSKTEETNGVLPPPPEPTPAVFTSKLVSPIHTFFVMIICLGCVHLLCILIMASFLLLPLHQYLLVLGMLVVLMFIPINENSKWGLALARHLLIGTFYLAAHIAGDAKVRAYEWFPNDSPTLPIRLLYCPIFFARFDLYPHFFWPILTRYNSLLSGSIFPPLVYGTPGYFPATLYVEDIKDFNPDQAYVFGYEPHSVWSIGAETLSALTGFMPTGKVKVPVSTALLYTPFLRHLCTWLGASAATRENFVSLLKDGYSCVVIPGGVQESFYMEHHSEVAFLKARKGFIRLAMETNSPLVPLFAFGQSYIYNWWKPRGKFFLKLSRAIKFMPLVFWGALWSPIPLRRPILVAVGKPIHFKKNSAPTTEEVSEVHD